MIKSVLFIWVIVSITNISAQQSSSPKPSISFISTNSTFLDTVFTTSNFRTYPGSYVSFPTTTVHKSYLFEFRVSVIIHEKSDTQMPLGIKIISPGKVSQIYTLEEDISKFNVHEKYDYNLKVGTEEFGWFTAELVNYNGFNPEKDKIIFDKTTVYFR
ncbi:MAG: hypothetical protein ACM3Q2_15870 [Syntrophothermus sp.]